MKKPKVTVIYDTPDDLQLKNAFHLLAQIFKEQHDEFREEAGSEGR